MNQTILIVDDEERIGRVYKNILSSEGYKVITTTNVVEARKIIKAIPVHLILLDINMGELRGDILYEIAQSFHRHIKIMVSSVYPVEEQRELMPEADAYFDKSEGNKALLKKVNHLLKKGGSSMKKNNILLVMAVFIFSSFVIMPVEAQEDIQALKNQIQALQKRVEELESARSQRLPSSHSRRSYAQQWDPFAEIERMQQEMNRMFQHSFSHSGWFGNKKGGMFRSNMFYDGNFDIQETKEGYTIQFDMSGLDQNKIDIDVNEHSITISGEQSSQVDESNEHGFYRSRSFGSFLKTVPLPVDADTKKMETKKEGDKLIIKIPRKQ